MKIFGNNKLRRIILPAFMAGAILLCSMHLSASNKEKDKILLIGLDGAGWSVMTPFIEEGKLPNIKRLIDNGCRGRLETIFPMTSEVIWTTIATGKTPDVHGISSNLTRDPDTGELVPPTSNVRRVKAIWNILSEHKKKVGMIGYLVSWPAEKVNGVIISERANTCSYRGSFRYSEPPFIDLCTEEIFNSFKIGINNPVGCIDGKLDFDRDIFMSNLAKFLLKNKEFDFFCLYLRGIDSASHYYWKYMFPEQRNVAADTRTYRDTIKNYYIWCDRVIGDLLRIIDKNTTVIVVSDHGFKTFARRDCIFSKVDNLLEACGLNKFKYNSKTVTIENIQYNVWEYKKNIRITGDLTKNEFNAVRENAKNILGDIKFAETGEPVFKISNNTDKGFIFEADREYINNRLVHRILINGREYQSSDFFIENPFSGDHDGTDAIIIMSGKNIRQHLRIDNASVYDIAPTMLYLSNLPVAKDMRGNVLTSVINPKLLKEKNVRRIDTYEDGRTEGIQKPIRSPEDEKIIKERMRSLGYIN